MIIFEVFWDLKLWSTLLSILKCILGCNFLSTTSKLHYLCIYLFILENSVKKTLRFIYLFISLYLYICVVFRWQDFGRDFGEQHGWFIWDIRQCLWWLQLVSACSMWILFQDLDDFTRRAVGEEEFKKEQKELDRGTKRGGRSKGNVKVNVGSVPWWSRQPMHS